MFSTEGGYFRSVLLPLFVSLRSLQEMIFGGELPDEVDRFTDVNQPTWTAFQSDQVNNSGYVLIDWTIPNFNYIYPITLIGLYISDIEDYSAAVFTEHIYNKMQSKLYPSFGIDRRFPFRARYLSPLTIFRAVYNGSMVYRSLNNPDDILSITHNGVEIGDLVYNTYLRYESVGTIEELDRTVFALIVKAFIYVDYFDQFLDDVDIKAIVTRDIHYIGNGLLLRIAVNKSDPIPVYVPGSDRQQITVKEYDHTNYQEHNLRPTESLVESVYNCYNDELNQAVEKYMYHRLNGGTTTRTDAFDETKERLSREEIVKRLNIDPDNPNVVIMSHVMTDAVHVGDLLFSDYQTWLRKTVEFAVEFNGVNWIVKSHPNEEAPIYNCDYTSQSIVKSILEDYDDHNVRIMPEDVSTASLESIADVILTARGTAALEFGCLGIPSIIAGESNYSGFGFTNEPETKEQYFAMLQEIHEVDALSEHERHRAKTLAYIRFILLRTETSMVEDPMVDFWEFDLATELRGAVDVLNEKTPSDDLLYDHLARFLNDDLQQKINYHIATEHMGNDWVNNE